LNDVRRAVAEWLPLFFRPDDVLEVRFLGVKRQGRTAAGWLRAGRIPALAGTIASYGDLSNAVYFTPQRLRADVLGRSRPELFAIVFRDGVKSRPELTGDADVEGRRFLLVDVDPVRPAGESSTDGEKEAARHVADAVRSALVGQLAAPLVVDSGNGFHLYYRLPAELPGGPVADSTRDPLARWLAVLAGRFDTPAAKVDRTVFNASRIMKAPGTWARKGPNTTARPHRQSRVMEVPNGWSV
jgi:hypothetical protein